MYDPVVDGDNVGRAGHHDKMVGLEPPWQDMRPGDDFYDFGLQEVCNENGNDSEKMLCVPSNDEYDGVGYGGMLSGMNGVSGSIKEEYQEESYGHGFMGNDIDDDNDMDGSTQNIGSSQFFSGGNNDDLNGI